jgi:two-component sensor histidine kinase
MSVTRDRSDDALTLTRALIARSAIPLLLFDGEPRVVCASRSFYGAFDLRPSEVDGRVLAEIGQGEWDIPQVRLLLEHARLGGLSMGAYETELMRPGRSSRRLVVNAESVLPHDAEGAVLLLTFDDVTDSRRDAKANVALLLKKDDMVKERDVLLQEMQHRVANSLQIIASVLLLKARTVKSEETKLHLRDAHDRVMSVAAIQKHLETNLTDVEIDGYLVKLCESLASSMIRESRPLGLYVEAQETTISSQEAVSLGLIVTELVINALKHAFPDSRAGRILVEYKVQGTGWTLSVSDDGVGRPPTETDAKVGLGTSIVEAIGHQLGARVVVTDASPGTRVSLIRDDEPA